MTTRDNPADERAGSWAREALAGVFARAAREQAAAEEHVRTCTERPCDRCMRYVCKRCAAPVDGAETCRACDAARYLAARLKPTRDSVPPHFRWTFDATPETLRGRVQASAEIIRRGLEAPPSASVLFMGPTGAGKTSLAVAMLDAWVRAAPGERQGALFVESAWLSRARARHRLGDGEAPLVADAMTCPLLVLDDLGSEREDRDGCITDVVWTRTNNDLPLWVTTGLGTGEDHSLDGFAAAIAKRYDGGFVRRIVEASKRVTLGKP